MPSDGSTEIDPGEIGPLVPDLRRASSQLVQEEREQVAGAIDGRVGVQPNCVPAMCRARTRAL